MSKFVVNTENTMSIRKAVIDNLTIEVFPATTGLPYELRVGTTNQRGVAFETDATLEGVQAKAAIILAALEED